MLGELPERLPRTSQDVNIGFGWRRGHGLQGQLVVRAPSGRRAEGVPAVPRPDSGRGVTQLALPAEACEHAGEGEEHQHPWKEEQCAVRGGI